MPDEVDAVAAMDGARLQEFYLGYNHACNAHDFGSLRHFVHPDVTVNGAAQGLDDYVAGLRSVVAEFPGFQWQIQHLLVQTPWVAAHFEDRLGPHPGDDLSVTTPGPRQEFAFYRVASGRIVEVWDGTDSYDR